MKKEGDIEKGQAGNGDQVRETLVGIKKTLALTESKVRTIKSSEQRRDKM